MTQKIVRRALSFAVVLLALPTACHHQAVKPAEVAAVSNRMPRNAARFLIESASDTTVVFRSAEASWLRTGMRAIVVDPAQRDALVGRVTILSVDTVHVVATITGKVSQLSAAHAVLIMEPGKSWWKDHRFWFGLIGGGIVGAAAVSASH